MKKVLFALFLCVAFAVPVFSSEAICAPGFEVVGMNPDHGISSARVLQGNMQTRMHSRQLVLSLPADSIAVTDDLSRQINWAKSRNCAYLLQTTLTRLGESVQVSVRFLDVNANSYAFNRAYKASSPDDLHPIFSQLGNMLQDPKFTAVETIYDVTSADARALRKKKSSTYYSIAVGGAYLKDFEDLYGLGLGFFWDGRTFMGEAVVNFLFSSNDDGLSEYGLRFYYPFSAENSTVYIGGGVGFAVASKEDDSHYSGTRTDAGLLIESSVGYMVGRTSNVLFRIEGYGTSIIHEGSFGGGLRLILGIGY